MALDARRVLVHVVGVAAVQEVVGGGGGGTDNARNSQKPKTKKKNFGGPKKIKVVASRLLP